MRRNRTTILLLVVSIGLLAMFMIGSFVTYAQPISSTEMQNIYLRRITRFGTAICLLQLASLILTAAGRRRSTAAHHTAGASAVGRARFAESVSLFLCFRSAWLSF